ncbi:MAG: tetratricopeptide repeat protein [Candidatus Marinimicrobia bacterium]|nr:tetratricopeptide repeat protein [Candidatus Neomarinimicrobiota bacterium]MCF7827814.1 tetratricopeptide repeat protein [Candidatus Neomarinimicrobiota bacterium]MCF7879431.1 tetratricopeptide repeat protein [Candidatus Neomarinimicrobiota bacterium]
MNKRFLLFFSVGISLLLLLGCSSARQVSGDEPHSESAVSDTSQLSKQELLEQKRMDVLEMESQIENLHDEVSNLKNEIVRLKEENQTLQHRLRQRYRSSSGIITGDDGGVEIDSLSDTYRELLITRNLQSAENKAIAAEIKHSDSLYTKSEDLSGMLDPISKDEYRERYNKALNEYFRANYYRAIAEFQTLLIIDKHNDYADNAQYWIAESYYSMEDYKKAAEEFERVLNFPATNKGDHAQFKRALCYLKLDNKMAAREAFESLKKDYPKSDLLPRVTEYMEVPNYNNAQ